VNTEWILTKFAGDNHWHQQLKWLHFGRNCNGQWSGIWQNVLWCQTGADT